MDDKTRAYKRKAVPPSTATTIRVEKALIDIARSIATTQKIPLAEVYNGLMWIGFEAMRKMEGNEQLLSKDVDNTLLNLYIAGNK